MEHIWKIYELKRTISTGVVNEVTYACESSDSGYSTRTIGLLQVTGTAEDVGFIEYTSLVESDVLIWLNTLVDKNSIETKNADYISNKISTEAAVTTGTGVPWE